MICKYCESEKIELIDSNNKINQYFCKECESVFTKKENKMKYYYLIHFMKDWWNNDRFKTR